jgi:hypothetical protein
MRCVPKCEVQHTKAGILAANDCNILHVCMCKALPTYPFTRDGTPPSVKIKHTFMLRSPYHRMKRAMLSSDRARKDEAM